MMNRAAGALLCGWCFLVLAGCAGATKPKPAAELPELSSIIQAHNDRVQALEPFWARASVRVEGHDAQGSKFSEQGNGHLQFERPGDVAITLGKLGEVYFALGSNDERYWLIDVSDSSRRLMVSGAQAFATPGKAAALGLPVHPRDIPLLLGLVELDPESVRDPVFNQSGEVVVGVPSRWGGAELRFDPRTLDLIGAAAFDDEGTMLANAKLSRHVDVRNNLAQGTLGRVPSTAEIRVPGFDGFVRMMLNDPRVRSINPMVFDPDRLNRAYRVRERIDLDEPTSDDGT